MVACFNAGGDPSALVVSAVGGDFFATRAESGDGNAEIHGGFVVAVDFGFKTAVVLHHAGFAGDRSRLFHEEGEGDINMRFFGVEPLSEAGKKLGHVLHADDASEFVEHF